MSNDLRTSSRHEFPYEQLVAELTEGRMPGLGDFQRVPCDNVSGSGIAFYLEQKPAVDEYVVALGSTPDLTYLCARVVHSQRVPRQGQLRYRVGCQLTGRARLDRNTLRVIPVNKAPALTSAAR